MMLASLRTRLWLSYALLIGMVLVVVGASFFLVLARSSLAARQAVPRLRGAEGAAFALLEVRALATPDREQVVLDRVAQLYPGIHLAILNQDGTVATEGGMPNYQPYPKIPLPLTPNATNLANVYSTRDAQKRVWFYTLHLLDAQAQTYLMVATPRPVIPWLTTLTDDLGRPLIEAAGIAMVAAFILALLMGRWITNPLRRITEAARKVAAGDIRPIDPQGPTEVKELANSFNAMTHKVQTSQQSQRDFVANVSHELKTPLTAIQGFAQAIVDGAASSPDILRQAGEVILNESDRMYRLVTDLLALARLDAGTANLVKEPVDLREVLEGVVVKFEPAARRGQVSLESQVSPLPVFMGDGDRLAQVFSNLVDNAIKFTPNGRVIVSARQDGRQVEIRVSDTGIGIAAEDQKRIFERFYQTDKSRRGGTGRGVGLGLAIARQVVQAEGGTISVTSAVGKGSEFVVRLPIEN
jgi:two-component system OmpR family sensor kinase